VSSSYGHAIRALSAEEIANRTRLGYWCSSGKCREQVACDASYRYVTGRSGRTTERNTQMCAEHGKKFAAKHGLELRVVDGESR
jgi:hypothetical protein